ncbi:glycosyltransferase family 4 protein [Belliella kenyensis]|uniref:Glycosyltransferase family 4 protein n=1 Tax=Belliella kenyensis TaxID=1472724 RepID=A0ABV8EET9_9BACT|nr:glycosyltransferase family 4 protein [Belliella kenyensis]MCH7401902.1 glycosyltransferase family 4 protein [Belliella kenyensis]MDN3604402.1 glycosyltransferase family 4 protein [Belliella kenyensis]
MLLYIYPVETAFTQRDVAMLHESYKVKCLKFTQSPVLLPFFFLLQFFQLLLFLPFTNKYLCFFGGYHSILPVWFGQKFGIKTYIQSGGTDATNMPVIQYGNFRKKWLRKATVYSFQNCTKILPVADSLVGYDYKYDENIPTKQGLKNLIPSLQTPIEVIYNGFDHEFWKDLGQERTSNSFITIAKGISHPTRALIKGIDLIEFLAGSFPDCTFTIVGDQNYPSKSKNIHLIGELNADSLKSELNKHRFYLQLSMSEGFPNALAEAMLCGCIPIGSAVGDIPTIIGKTGLILPKKDVNLLKFKLKDFLSIANQNLLRSCARNRIVDNFTFEKRKRALLKVLSE